MRNITPRGTLEAYFWGYFRAGNAACALRCAACAVSPCGLPGG